MVEYSSTNGKTVISMDRSFKYIIGDILKVLGSKAKYLIIEHTNGFFNSECKIVIYTEMEIEFYTSLVFIRINERVKSLDKVDELISLLEVESIVKHLINPVDVTKYKLDKGAISNMRYQPLSHQMIYFEQYDIKKRLFNLRGAYLEGAVGSGKTYMALAQTLLNKNKITIIISPLNAKYKVWYNSLTVELFKTPQDICIIPEDKYNNERFILVHYQALDKLLNFLKKNKFKESMLIIDEAHNFNSKDTKQVNTLDKIIEILNPKDIQLLSGTPIKAGTAELDFTIRTLSPKLPTSVSKRLKGFYKRPTSYAVESARLRYYKYSIKIKKDDMELSPYYELDNPVKILNPEVYYIETIRSEMLKYSKTRIKEINKNRKQTDKQYVSIFKEYSLSAIDKKLLTIDEVNLYIKYTAIIRAFYDGGRTKEDIPLMIRHSNRIETTLMTLMDQNAKKRFKELKSLYKYPVLKILGEALGNIVGGARISASIEMSKHIDYEHILQTTDKKVIVFTNYIDSCKSIENILAKNKIGSVGVYGEYTKDLNKQIDRFSKSDDIKFLVATYKSLSTAVPLIMADRIIAVDLPFRDYIWQQAIGRAWRLGQDSAVYVYKTFIDTGDIPNITTRTINILELTKKMAEYIVGHEVPTSDEDISSSIDKMLDEDSGKNRLLNIIKKIID